MTIEELIGIQGTNKYNDWKIQMFLKKDKEELARTLAYIERAHLILIGIDNGDSIDSIRYDMLNDQQIDCSDFGLAFNIVNAIARMGGEHNA